MTDVGFFVGRGGDFLADIALTEEQIQAGSNQVVTMNAGGQFIDQTGGVRAQAVVATPGSAISASGSLGLGSSGGVLSGFNVASVTPTATVAVYDATSATGTPIWSFSAAATGAVYPAPGVRLALATAGYVSISGTLTLVPWF